MRRRAVADDAVLLNFHKSANVGFVADPAIIEIDQVFMKKFWRLCRAARRKRSASQPATDLRRALIKGTANDCNGEMVCLLGFRARIIGKIAVPAAAKPPVSRSFEPAAQAAAELMAADHE
jgi:hypothetical protein